MPSCGKKTKTKTNRKKRPVNLRVGRFKLVATQKQIKESSREAGSQILLRKPLVADGTPNLDTVPQSALNLLAQGMSSVAFKLSFESGSIILKRSRVHDPDTELGNPDTPLKRELAFYKMIDELPVLEQQFLARCYDWRLYDKCLYAGRGLRAFNPLKPAVKPGVCLDMLLEYKGSSLADWLNARYLHTEPKSGLKSTEKTGTAPRDALAKLGIQIGGKRYLPKEPYRLLYSIFWQLAMIFKSLGKLGWLHVDAHPHNITVVNGLTLANGSRIDYSPQKIAVPTVLVPTEVVYRLEQPPAPEKNNGIPISQRLPTQGIQIALIDYNLVRHPDFQRAEWMFAPFGTKLVGDEGIAARNLELKRRVLALVFGEHKMMEEVRRRDIPLRNFRVTVAANTEMAKRYPEEWQEWIMRMTADPDRALLGYPDYLSNIRRKINYAHDDIEASKYVFRMLYMRIESELFWLWQIDHAAEICALYGFDTTYTALLPRDRVMELFFSTETRTPDNLIIWCCEKLGVRPINHVTTGVNSKRPELAQKNEAE